MIKITNKIILSVLLVTFFICQNKIVTAQIRDSDAYEITKTTSPTKTTTTIKQYTSPYDLLMGNYYPNFTASYSYTDPFGALFNQFAPTTAQSTSSQIGGVTPPTKLFYSNQLMTNLSLMAYGFPAYNNSYSYQDPFGVNYSKQFNIGGNNSTVNPLLWGVMPPVPAYNTAVNYSNPFMSSAYNYNFSGF
ncbi:MAG: hypothetical protein V1872_03070 [bacterium]